MHNSNEKKTTAPNIPTMITLVRLMGTEVFELVVGVEVELVEMVEMGDNVVVAGDK